MSKQTRLSGISFFDKVNVFFVRLITPEIRQLDKIRLDNLYSQHPTIDHDCNMDFEFIVLDGVRIRVSRSFCGAGKETIVFLSAFPHSIMAYSHVWGILKSKYNLYAYDMPGFGASDIHSRYMSVSYQGVFLQKFLKHYGIENSHLVAPDVGMAAALSYVISCKAEVKSVIIGDGPGSLPLVESSVMKRMVHSPFWRFVFALAGSGTLIESSRLLGNVVYTPNRYEISDYKQSYKGKVFTIMKWFKSYKLSLVDIDKGLKDIRVPTKIFWGECEAILPMENGFTLSSKIDGSELEIFENCGHFVYQDCYTEFSRMIDRWVDDHK